MPLYDYKCPKCGTIIEISEHINRLGAIRYKCEKKLCGGILKRIITGGFTHGDERTWLESTTENLKGTDAVHKAPIRSMTEYKRLLKEKGVEAAG